MTSNTTAQTQATLTRHTQAMMSGDIAAIVNNFAEDAVIFTQGETYRGHDQIRSFLEYGMSNLPAGYMDAFEVLWQDVAGEVVYLVYKAEPFVRNPGVNSGASKHSIGVSHKEKPD